MCLEPSDVNCAAYFAEDVIEYALRYRCIFWKASRPDSHVKLYSYLSGDAKFNSNIGHALLLKHAGYEPYVKRESTEIWTKIQSERGSSTFTSTSVRNTFMNYVQKAYETKGINLETLLLILSVVVSSCVPLCRNGFCIVLNEASRSIRDAVLQYPKRPSETIKELQLLASKMTLANC